jgi:hypothetical protein
LAICTDSAPGARERLGLLGSPLLYDLLDHESAARKDAMTAAHIDGLIARGKKDRYLPFSEIEKVAGELDPDGLDVLYVEHDLSLAKVSSKLGITRERVRQIEAVALEHASLARELQELHERAA